MRFQKRLLIALIITITAGGFVFSQTQYSHAKTPQTQGAPGSFADLAEKLLPTVVNISSQQHFDADNVLPEFPEFPEGSPFEQFFENFLDRRKQDLPSAPPASLGSGFIIDAAKGIIITNNHVIQDAEEVRVTFHDDISAAADILGSDEKTDLAVLQIKPEDMKGLKLSATGFGDSDVLRVGDWVMAIGNPFGLGGTVTAGIISARKRDINSGPYDDYLQTDASINRGNSGGPMFNLQGQVIGINTAIFSPSGGSVGIGFAIPSNLASPVLNQLIKYGRTRRGWLGVRIQEVTEDIAASLELKKPHGALISSVTKDGPAEKSGIEAGDVVLSFDNRPITQMRELPRIVAETDIGKKVNVVVWRDGKNKTIKVSLGELEKAEDDGLLEQKEKKGPSTKGDLKIEKEGLSLSILSDELRERFNIGSDIDGVAVTDVKPGSEAATKGLISGDVIVELNQKPVNDPKRIAALIDDARDTGRKSVLLLINRDGDIRFIALRLK